MVLARAGRNDSRPDAEAQHQSAGLEDPRNYSRPDAEAQHQSAGLEDPRR